MLLFSSSDPGTVCAWGWGAAGGLAASAWPRAQPRTPGLLRCVRSLTAVSRHKSAEVQLWFLLPKLNPRSGFFPLRPVRCCSSGTAGPLPGEGRYFGDGSSSFEIAAVGPPCPAPGAVVLHTALAEQGRGAEEEANWRAWAWRTQIPLETAALCSCGGSGLFPLAGDRGTQESSSAEPAWRI